MQIIDNIIILLLPVIAFIAGKKISDSYNNTQIQQLEFQIRLLSAERGVGYVAPPVKKKVPIGQPFMDRLHEHGRAVQQLTPEKQYHRDGASA